MEKIWVKKEVYKWRYEIWNFIEFFGIYFYFSGIFLDLFPHKKMQKGFIYSRGTREVDMARRAHVAEPHMDTWMRLWTT